MALVDTQPVLYPFSLAAGDVTGQRDKLINASGERVAMILQAPETGTITAVDILTDVVTTADDLDIRIETTSEASSDNFAPTGTLWGTNTNGTLASGSISAATMHTVTLTSGASVTKGDIIAIVVQFTSDTTSSGDLEIRVRGNYSILFPIVQHRTGGSWARDVNARPVVGLSYSGTYYPMNNIGTSHETDTVSTVSAGKEYGVKFTAPFDCQLSGLIVDNRTSGNLTMELYEDGTAPGSGTELLGGFEPPATGSNSGSWFILSNPQVLTKGTVYRVTVDPTTSVNSNHRRLIFSSTAMKDQDYPSDWVYTEDDGAGGWTDTTTQVAGNFKLILNKIHGKDNSGATLAIGI